jgi:hypothetical protein
VVGYPEVIGYSANWVRSAASTNQSLPNGFPDQTAPDCCGLPCKIH